MLLDQVNFKGSFQPKLFYDLKNQNKTQKNSAAAKLENLEINERNHQKYCIVFVEDTEKD